MDRFVSTFTNKLDAKGRVSIPAPFRAVLESDLYGGAPGVAKPIIQNIAFKLSAGQGLGVIGPAYRPGA